MQIHPVWTPEMERKPNVPLKYNTLCLKRGLEEWLISLAETKIFKIEVNMETVQTGMISLLLMFQFSCNFRSMVLGQSGTAGQAAVSKSQTW